MRQKSVTHNDPESKLTNLLSTLPLKKHIVASDLIIDVSNAVVSSQENAHGYKFWWRNTSKLTGLSRTVDSFEKSNPSICLNGSSRWLSAGVRDESDHQDAGINPLWYLSERRCTKALKNLRTKVTILSWHFLVKSDKNQKGKIIFRIQNYLGRGVRWTENDEDKEIDEKVKHFLIFSWRNT